MPNPDHTEIDDERVEAPDLREITEEGLHKKRRRSEQEIDDIIGNMNPDEIAEWLRRNRMKDLLRKMPEIGRA